MRQLAAFLNHAFLCAGQAFGDRTNPANPTAIDVAVVNSKRIGFCPAKSSPACVGGEKVGVFHAGAGFGHHRGDGVAPKLVVGGLLVRGRRLGRAVDLDEHEARRIVRLLDDVEPGDAGFADRLPGVFQTRGREGLDATGFYVNSDVDDEQGELALKDG